MMGKAISKAALVRRIAAGLRRLCPKDSNCPTCNAVRRALTGEK